MKTTMVLLGLVAILLISCTTEISDDLPKEKPAFKVFFLNEHNVLDSAYASDKAYHYCYFCVKKGDYIEIHETAIGNIYPYMPLQKKKEFKILRIPLYVSINQYPTKYVKFVSLCGPNLSKVANQDYLFYGVTNELKQYSIR